MPRKQPKLILAAYGAAAARRIVANQRGLIAMLKSKGEPAVEAEGMLEVYLSSLKLLEDCEDKIRRESKIKKGETKKRRSN
ncbi:MAG: hypothetical protein ACLPTZ_00495 [Beijerinckiaceae bacterium]|jgi:hypothetical protein